MRLLKVFFWWIVACVSAAVIGASLIAFSILMLPKVGELKGCLTTSMYKVHLCAEGSHYVRLREISPYVLDAVIASEDGAFYSHKGFDWFEMEQSFKANLSDGQIRRGGSTITQQLAKNIWLSKEKSYVRKLKEAYLTYQLERSFDKSFILEKYMNVVQFGPKLFGVKDAANYYFKKSPSELHLLESVFLAFLLPNPDVYSKSFQKSELSPFANKIINVILKRLVQFKKITPDEYQFAVAQIANFPWTGLTIADFKNAAPAGDTAAIETSEDDEKAFDQFSNETIQDESTAEPEIE